MSLDLLGLTRRQSDTSAAAVPDGFTAARVLTVNRTNLVIDAGTGPVTAEVTGRLRYAADSPMELPAVGDWVVAQLLDDGAFAVITEVLPRTSVLKRRLPGRRAEYQPMAANVDTAFILHPADQPVHVRRLERYLVIARDGGVEPVIVLSKVDLVPDEALAESLEQARALADAVAASAVRPGGLDAIAERLVPGRTVVLLGPSGVGKSTLLNALLGEVRFATRDVRTADRKGRHTTTRRELVRLENGALLIDTPGMRELGLTDDHEGLEDTFADLVALAEACRFRDCTHTQEAGCAVRAAVEAGEIEAGRHQSWLRLGREMAHYERTVREQRERDRAFGKMAREVLKRKKDRR